MRLQGGGLNPAGGDEEQVVGRRAGGVEVERVTREAREMSDGSEVRGQRGRLK
jgi:hypothetical protein